MLAAVVTRVGGSWEMRNGPEYLYEALDFVGKGKVKVITETYKLDEAPNAY
jgi:D-arabinose 1-dehydrogenase-like Zn-dependent alcohol dehydrogenase